MKRPLERSDPSSRTPGMVGKKLSSILENMEIANEVQVDKHFPSPGPIFDARKASSLAIGRYFDRFFANLIYYHIEEEGTLFSYSSSTSLNNALLAWLRYYLYKSPYKRLGVFGPEPFTKLYSLSGQIQTQETLCITLWTTI